MSDQPRQPKSTRPESTESESTESESPEPAWKRKRRLAEVFGDVLPETTSDERTPAADETPASDAWLKAQVPPHHG